MKVICIELFVVALTVVLVPQVIKAWKHGHATFYEGGPESFGGACGYKDVVLQGYGQETAAVSGAIFQDGRRCGACFELKCVDDPQWCRPGKPTLTVTATNLCPPGGAGWCDQPKEHFDIAKPVFNKLVNDYTCGVIPIKFRRVPCKKQGGVKFTITGNPYFNEVQVWNVAGAGNVDNVQVKGDKSSKWINMKRLWGEKWQTGTQLVGQELTFRVQTADGKTIESSVAPHHWQFGQTYEALNNIV